MSMTRRLILVILLMATATPTSARPQPTTTTTYSRDLKKVDTLRSKKRYQQAVATLQRLANDSSRREDKIGFLERAVDIQREWTRWPKVVPWDRLPPQPSKASLRSMVSVYTDLLVLAPERWEYRAHLGLLYLRSGELQDTQDVWHQGLEKFPRGQDAARAAGWLLEDARSKKQWDKLETTARLCLRQGIRAAGSQRKALDSSELLGLALFEGGRKDVDNNRFADGITRLSAYLLDRTAPSRSEALWLLARAYDATGDSHRTVETLNALTGEFPRSRRAEEALFMGFDRARKAAFEENTLTFGEQYLARFDKRSDEVRERLVDLYVGRELFGPATRHLARASQTARRRDRRREASRRWLDLEIHYGESANQSKAASALLALAPRGSEDWASAKRVLALHAMKTGKLDQLERFQRDLRSFAHHQHGSDALSELHFMRAEVLAADVDPSATFDLRGSSQPLTALRRLVTRISHVTREYRQACEPIDTAYCAASLHQLARFAERSAQALDATSIASTLDRASVQSFEQEKNTQIEALLDSAEEADAQSMQSLKRGPTSPLWAQAVLWHNARDWIFERLDNDAGQAYIQWTFAPKSTTLDADSILTQPGRKDTILSGRTRREWTQLANTLQGLDRSSAALAAGAVDVGLAEARAAVGRSAGEAAAHDLLAVALAANKKFSLARYYADVADEVRGGKTAVTANVRAIASLMRPNLTFEDFRQARNTLSEAIDLDSTLAAPALNLAFLNLSLGDAIGASAQFDVAASRCQQCTVALVGQGIASTRTGQIPRAVQALETAMDREPKQYGSLFHLAMAYRLGDKTPERAIATLTRLLDATSGTTQPAQVDLRRRAHALLRLMRGERSEAQVRNIDEPDMPSQGGLMTGHEE